MAAIQSLITPVTLRSVLSRSAEQKKLNESHLHDKAILTYRAGFR